MKMYFQKRSLYTFCSIVFGIVILVNLIRLDRLLEVNILVTPYFYTMLGAIICASLGFLFIKPQLLGYSTVFWILSLAFNLYAFIFIIPIMLLNIIGRNKVLNVMDTELDELNIEVKECNG